MIILLTETGGGKYVVIQQRPEKKKITHPCKYHGRYETDGDVTDKRRKILVQSSFEYIA